MKVQVQLLPLHEEDGGRVDTFANAGGWHVDEERQLHVKAAGSGHLAAYATGAWASVRQAEDV